MEDIKSNKNGHLLLLDAKTENQHFVLLNIYNTNIEKNQLSIFNEVKNKLNSINNIATKQIIIDSDLNFCFDWLLETKDRKKKKLQ